MARSTTSPSPRRQELLEAAYAYAQRNGLGDLSLRPLPKEIQTSPRVLLYLFNSKEGLIRALLARALSDETLVMDQARAGNERAALQTVARELWRWLSADSHRGVLALWALDLLATGDLARTTAAVHLQLDSPA